MAVVAVECLDETDTPMPRVSAWLRHPWVVAGTASEKSHVIRLQVFQVLKWDRWNYAVSDGLLARACGNYVRNLGGGVVMPTY